MIRFDATLRFSFIYLHAFVASSTNSNGNSEMCIYVKSLHVYTYLIYFQETNFLGKHLHSFTRFYISGVKTSEFFDFVVGFTRNAMKIGRFGSDSVEFRSNTLFLEFAF